MPTFTVVGSLPLRRGPTPRSDQAGPQLTRILTLTSWYPPHHAGGYELACFDVMTRFADRGHQVEVLCSDERLPGVADPDNRHEANVHRDLKLYFEAGELWAPSLPGRWAIERANQRALGQALDRHRPDVVSVWHMGALSLGLLTTVIERGIPIVYVISDDWLSYGPKLDAWARLWVGPRRSVVGRIVRPLVRVPTVLPDLGSSGTFCFVSDVTRRRAEEHSAWTFPMAT